MHQHCKHRKCSEAHQAWWWALQWWWAGARWSQLQQVESGHQSNSLQRIGWHATFMHNNMIKDKQQQSPPGVVVGRGEVVTAAPRGLGHHSHSL